MTDEDKRWGTAWVPSIISGGPECCGEQRLNGVVDSLHMAWMREVLLCVRCGNCGAEASVKWEQI